MTEGRRHDLGALAFLTLLPVVFFFDVFSGERAFFMRDLVRFHHPSKKVLREIVRGGEFPHWNPYVGGGQPLAANPQNEVFYPLNWLIFLRDYNVAFQLLILVHLFIALFAMYALLRSLDVRPPAAVIGAAAFGMGGIVLSYAGLLPFLFCVSWLPLTCLFARRFLLHRLPRDFALASLFLGMQFLVGEPTTILQTATLVGGYAAVRAFRLWKTLPSAARPLRAAVTTLLLALAIGAGGLFAGAAQTLPMLDHARDSVRARGIPFASVSLWSMPPSRLGELIYPSFFGHIQSADHRFLYWGAGVYGPQRSPFLFSIYAGLLIAVMTAAGLVTRARGWLFALILIAGSIILALGAHTPLLRLLYDAGVRSIRYPEKFILIAVFTIVVFGSRTLDRFFDGDRRLRISSLVITATILCVALSLAAAGATRAYASAFLRFWNFSPSPLASEMIAISHSDWIAAAARAAALLLLLAFVNRIRRPLWTLLAVLFVVADLASVIRETAQTTDASLFTTTPIAAQKLNAVKGDFRIFHEAQWHQRTPVAAEYIRRLGTEPAPFRNAMFPIIPSEFGLATVMEADYDLTALLPTADFADAARQVGPHSQTWPQPLAAMSNAWFRTIYRPFDDAFALAGGDVRRMQPVAFLRLEPHPRYYFADRVVTIRGKQEFVEKLLTERFTNSVAFVDGPAFVPAPGVVRQAAATANRIRLEVESRGRGFLVLSVTPHKYWRARIDGTAARPVVVNIGYQGLEIPPGRHIVEMRYRNPLLGVGIAISLITLIGLLAIVCRMRAP